MTREERNTKLKHFITCLKCEMSGKVCDDNCSVQYKAGNMGKIIENLEAISKALEQEPCEDAIGRSDMLDAIGHGTTYTSEELQRIIKVLPPVSPQSKTGHWINEKWNGTDLIGVTCSNCMVVESRFFDYCPNCGAKMVEPQESEGKNV